MCSMAACSTGTLMVLQVVALNRIAGLKYASMSVHTRETAFKQSLL